MIILRRVKYRLPPSVFDRTDRACEFMFVCGNSLSSPFAIFSVFGLAYEADFTHEYIARLGTDNKLVICFAGIQFLPTLAIRKHPLARLAALLETGMNAKIREQYLHVFNSPGELEA